MKICSKCHQEKDDSEFNKKGKSASGKVYLQPYCRECNKIASKEYYRRNKTKHIKAVRVITGARQQRFLEWKKTLKCEVCGENHPSCLDFHHRNPNDKKFTLSEGTSKVGWPKLMEEAAKCAVLCKNCHVKVHDGVIDLGSLV